MSSYSIGALFPKNAKGEPNVITSTSLQLKKIGNNWQIETVGASGDLTPAINITTNAVTIPGVNNFLKDYFIPQITGKDNPNTIWTEIYDRLLGKSELGNDESLTIFYRESLNKTLYTLGAIGYTGILKDYEDSTELIEPISGFAPPPEGATWSDIPSYEEEDNFYSQVLENLRDKDNYDPVSIWEKYSPNQSNSQTINSDYDITAIKEQINKLNDPTIKADLWYPHLLYTYGFENSTSYPGPVLFINPGDTASINFKNDIQINGLTQEEAQKATLIRNSTPGNSGSDGLAGTSSTNFHLHGAHTYPGGFGDNVVARYTTGQSWTTGIPIPKDHGIGSYWYHPHYHPSVNQQVYAGLTGFMQIGDPLSKIKGLEDIPRNLAIIKTMAVGIDENGELELSSFDNLGPAANRATMFTVNGEFQPTANASQGGWQALTLSNQTNQAFFNISLINDIAGTLPFWIYGEDGHQYPQIRSAKEAGVIGNVKGKLNENTDTKSIIDYAQAETFLTMLPPGKRLDVLVYLPDGKTEIAALRKFTQEGNNGTIKTYSVGTTGAYQELSSSNTSLDPQNPDDIKVGAGPLAIFKVNNGPVLPGFSALQAEIDDFNDAIEIQTITPLTKQEDYDSSKIPSVDLFQQVNGEDVWKPVRKREFHWTRGTLVGPKEEYDLATQQRLSALQEKYDGFSYEPFTALPAGIAGLEGEERDWLGYENPFLINDHVFPSGALNIAQLGTLEEWTNWNYSVSQLSAKKKNDRIDAEKYIAHPFHIHINDYQVKDADSELKAKRNLEDVTALNSSGYKYFNKEAGKVIYKEPLAGDFKEIAAALDPDKVDKLATWGANGQTIKMLFQDYTGAYVFHCHILPHEDAGMMLAMLVIENRRDSFLLPSELSSVEKDAEGVVQIVVHKADDLSRREISFKSSLLAAPKRAAVGDLSGDFVQDVVISSDGDGTLRIYDGIALKNSQTNLLSTLKPYENSTLAPWVFTGDISGDNKKDLVTIGFNEEIHNEVLAVADLTIKGWESLDGSADWNQLFAFNPWDNIPIERDPAHSIIDNLTSADISFSTGDYNLDNFIDIALAYRTKSGVRVSILDGAAIALKLQNNTFEGGYFPEEALLADGYIDDEFLAKVDQILLSSGFNLYGQGALENLLLTGTGSGQSKLYTLQLEAGHFIATSMPMGDAEMPMSDISAHHSSGVKYEGDRKITNLNPNIFKLHLIDEHDVGTNVTSVTPIFAGARGNGGLLVNGNANNSGEETLEILYAQGLGQGEFFNGQASTSTSLRDNKQQLIINLNEINVFSEQNLSFLKFLTLPDSREEQASIVNLLYRTYLGRLPDPSGAASWQADLAKGAYKNKDVKNLVNDFINAADGLEIKNHFGVEFNKANAVEITSTTYETLFGRLPSPTELNFWENRIESNKIDSQMLPFEILRYSQIGLDEVIAQPDQFIDKADPITQFLDTRDAETNLTVSGSIYREAAYKNTVGFYRITNLNGDVEDSQGNIFSPGDPQYRNIALSDFNRLTDTSANLALANNSTVQFQFVVPKGEIFAQFLAVNGDAGSFSDVYFAFEEANSDKMNHVTQIEPNTWGWEDLNMLGDQDYNDAIVKYAIDDQNRIKFIAKAGDYSNSQWANTANIEGSFGQGLSGERDTFDYVDQLLDQWGYFQTKTDYQDAYEEWKHQAVATLGGSELSNQGFF